MADSKFVLNYAGGGQLLKSDEMMAVCREFADGIANRAGEGYEISEYVGRNRVNVSVRTASETALQDNYENNTLLKSMGGD